MSDTEAVPEEPVEQAPEEVQEAPQYSPIEQEAMNMGWKPKEQWDGDENEWRDARTFVDRGQLLSEIHKLKRHTREQLQAMQDMKSMLAGAERKGREEALKELKKQKVEAMANGQYERVADIDEQIAETASTKTQATSSGESTPDVYVEYAKDWMPKNQWFASDEELKDEFETIIRGYVHKKASASGVAPDPEDAFEYATNRVKRMYPEKFKPQNRTNNAVASPSRTTSKTGAVKSKVSWADLSEDQRRMGARFIQQNLYASREEFIDDLRKSGELE